MMSYPGYTLYLVELVYIEYCILVISSWSGIYATHSYIANFTCNHQLLFDVDGQFQVNIAPKYGKSHSIQRVCYLHQCLYFLAIY